MEVTGSTSPVHRTEIGYQASGNMILLPQWAVFLMDLGLELGRRPEDQDGKLVVGLALPSRAYAAVLVAFGIIRARSSVEAAARENAEYFAFLKQQPHRTPVRFFRSGRIFKGELDSNAGRQDGEHLKVKYQDDGKLTCWRHFDVSDCTAIEVGADQADLVHRQRGYAVVQHPLFVENVVGKKAAERFCFTSRLECLIVGSVGKISEELFEEFAVRGSGGGWIPGILQDVVRVKRFFTGGQAFRSTVHPAVSRIAPSAASSETPPFVIYDSAAGYVKWHYEFRESVHVVLLDRSDRLFDDAVRQLTTRFYQRGGDAIDLDLSACPAAVESILFLENI